MEDGWSSVISVMASEGVLFLLLVNIPENDKLAEMVQLGFGSYANFLLNR